ncbi:MAG: sigma-70 family RNA polymerase sigma factor [Planctomycetes bacterium]|nr:sigma-70 family RNA polymerase sigma factor [Planctomycetota bacterium]
MNQAAPDDSKGCGSREHIQTADLGGAASDSAAVLELLQRMRAGDREAAALFMTRYGSRIRRRIRGKLSPAMRRIFDSQEILSTLGRRLDLYVRSGRLEAANEQQLWALVFRMASNAVIDKARVFRRLQQFEDEDGVFAQELSRRLRQAQRSRKEGVEIEIDRALNLLDDRTDRQILSLWLVGTCHTVIARHVDLAPTAVRKRWQKIKSELRERFAAEIHR